MKEHIEALMDCTLGEILQATKAYLKEAPTIKTAEELLKENEFKKN